MKSHEFIIVTGAASGIGRELVKNLSRSNVTLGLIDIKCSELNEVADDCRRLGVEVRVCCVDICHYEILRSFVAEFIHEFGTISSVFINAGLGPTQVSGDLWGDRRLMEVNYFGAVNTLNAVLNSINYRQESDGRTVIIHSGSIAKLVSTQRSGAYSASKAATARHFESIQLKVRDENVHIIEAVIGFVDTPMISDVRHFGRRFAIDAKWAANRLARMRFSNRTSVSIPFYRNLIWFILEKTPSRLRERLLIFIHKKLISNYRIDEMN